MAKKKQRIGGFRNIHIATIEDGEHTTPVGVEGAKSISAELNFELEEFESDDEFDHQEYIFTGGEGTLGIKSTSLEEFKLIFNNTYRKGGVEINANDLSKNVAILFERQKLDKKNKRLYILYNVKFSPAGIKAETAAKPGTEQIDELKFLVGQFGEGSIVYFIDTDDADVEPDQVLNWYKTVQFLSKEVIPPPTEIKTEDEKMKVYTELVQEKSKTTKK